MKINRVFSVILMLVLVCACSTAMARGEYLGELEVVNCKTGVSLRERPSTSADRITTVPLGCWVTGYYYNSEFVECNYNGMWGYILSTYLSGDGGKSSASSHGSDYLGKKTIVNCNEFVTLRSSPSTSASAVSRVAKGETVDCYYYDWQFTYCYYNGLSGYILSEYLSGNAPRYESSGSYSGSGSDYLGELTVINCRDWVSLRSSPSTSAERITTVPLGASVTAYYYNSEYVKCRYNGMWGYILSTYLSNSNGTSTSSSRSRDYLGKKTVVNCKEFVTLRSSPSTSASAVSRVAYGEVVDCYYYNSTFTYCYYNGLNGYILSSYLSSGYY